MSGEDDPDSELMTLELAPNETGISFGLPFGTYRSLASSALDAGADLMTIRKLRDERPGCIVDLYVKDCLFIIDVDVNAQMISLNLNATLDTPESSCVLSVEDSARRADLFTWHLMRQRDIAAFNEKVFAYNAHSDESQDD
jgi:hypothetical protein